MEFEKMDTKYYLKKIFEQIKIHNEKQDMFLDIMKDISMTLKNEEYTYADIKKEELRNILLKGSFTNNQKDTLVKIVDLFNEILTHNNNNVS